MNFIKIIMALVFAVSQSYAQTSGKTIEFNSVSGADYYTNFVINESAKKNAANTVVSNATVARGTTNKIDNVASFTVDASAQNGYVEFTLGTVYDPATSGNCEFKGVFKGDGTLYKAQIVDGSGNLLNQTSVLTNKTNWRPFSVTYPCAASGSRKVRITQTEAGTAPAINVGKLYYGLATNIGSGVPPNTFTALVSNTGVVSKETGADWINGNCTQSAGNFGCTFVSGIFSGSAPNCTGSLLESSSSDQTMNRIAADTTSVDVQTKTGAGTGTSIGFTISCTKTGSDYVQPAITPDIPRAPTIQKFTSGSGTYNTPAGVKYIRVRMVGGGGGGGGSGTNSGTASQAGTSSTFGSSLLIANGGSGGNRASTTAAGGSVTINNPAVSLVSISGGNSQGANIQNSSNTAATPLLIGGNGGSSFFGGNGAGSRYDNPGGNAVTNSGGGGGGAGCDSSNNNHCGSGGGAGGYIEAIIANPSSSYSYSVGSGGNGQAAGTAGYSGGGGGSGVIIVEEYYGTENVPLLLNTVYADTAVKAEKAAGLTSVDYGTYSATVTAGTNATSVTSPATCNYMRIGSVVSGSCRISVGCTTAAGTATTVTVTVPIATTQASTISGTIGSNITTESGRVIESGSNIGMNFACGATGATTRIMNFQYQVP